MPIEIYNGADADNYEAMSCHCFALSGTPANAAAVNTRYALLGDYMNGQAIPPEGQLRDRIANHDFTPGSTMALLRDEFGFARGMGTDIFLWGFFRNDQQLLPEHMWFTRGGRIFDTMPGHPIRRDANGPGANPPSEAQALDAGRCFSVEVSALYTEQVKFFTSAAWEPE
jgi:hypothetical protein